MSAYRNYAAEKRADMRRLIADSSPIECMQNLAYAIAEEGLAQGLSEEELQDIRTQYQQQSVWAFNSILRMRGVCTK